MNTSSRINCYATATTWRNRASSNGESLSKPNLKITNRSGTPCTVRVKSVSPVARIPVTRFTSIEMTVLLVPFKASAGVTAPRNSTYRIATLCCAYCVCSVFLVSAFLNPICSDKASERFPCTAVDRYRLTIVIHRYCSPLLNRKPFST